MSWIKENWREIVLLLCVIVLLGLVMLVASKCNHRVKELFDCRNCCACQYDGGTP